MLVRFARIRNAPARTLINHGDTEDTETLPLVGHLLAYALSLAGERPELIQEALTQEIIGAAIEVHRHVGPGLLESIYEECLCKELELRGIPFRRQVPLPITYKGMSLEKDYRLDLVVADRVVVELKCQPFTRVFQAQLLTYLRISGKEVGLFFDFNAPVLSEGMRRVVL